MDKYWFEVYKIKFMNKLFNDVFFSRFSKIGSPGGDVEDAKSTYGAL